MQGTLVDIQAHKYKRIVSNTEQECQLLHCDSRRSPPPLAQNYNLQLITFIVVFSTFLQVQAAL
jgi:hypothetical protein